MKSLNLHGQLVQKIEDLTGMTVDSRPIQGENLQSIATALAQWENGQTFKTDCRLDGLDLEVTKANIYEIRMAANQKESIIL